MSLMKRLDQAREAYRTGDLSSSAAAHTADRIAVAAREEHGAPSHAYMGDMVYGGLDGIVTTFAVVSGVAGAQLGSSVVLILGLANLFADGFSMAVGAYLPSKIEQEYYDREYQREAWEVEHFPKGERSELIEIYRAKGYSDEDTNRLVDIQTQKPELWVRTMMVEELGMMKDERNPMTSALATLGSFVLAGVLPLLVYLIGLAVPIPAEVSFPVSLGLSAVGLFALGAAKVRVTERNFLKSGLEMLVVGGAAAGVAYIVGVLLKGLGVGG
ncbi:MAG: VIT1/CCC1 transporter family protein [Chloroflexi bacterium]|nr:VIT1/CCC1 transporter family protein [Chloroflexota bacterium]